MSRETEQTARPAALLRCINNPEKEQIRLGQEAPAKAVVNFCRKALVRSDWGKVAMSGLNCNCFYKISYVADSGLPSRQSVARSHTAMQRDGEASGWLAAKTARTGHCSWSICRSSSSCGASALDAACRTSNRSGDPSPARHARSWALQLAGSTSDLATASSSHQTTLPLKI